MRSLFALIFLVLAAGAGAQGESREAPTTGPSGLKLPRFVSLAADEANLRSGPGLQYPVLWLYLRAGIPLEITAEFDTWRRVRDITGAEGWMHSSLLSGRRRAIVGDAVTAFLDRPAEGGRTLMRAEPGVVFDLLRCRPDWCEARLAGHKAWVRRGSFWGLHEGEIFD